MPTDIWRQKKKRVKHLFSTPKNKLQEMKTIQKRIVTFFFSFYLLQMNVGPLFTFMQEQLSSSQVAPLTPGTVKAHLLADCT